MNTLDSLGKVPMIEFRTELGSKHSLGFSLMEMSMVLLIVSLLMGGLLMSLSETQEMNRRSNATNLLGEITEALYGFAQANGRLPCPATAASAGVEAPLGGSVGAVTPCTQPHGFVPAVTLGLSGSLNVDNLLMDDWLNPYRYSVTTANSNAFTSANGMRTATMAALTPNLRICEEAACSNIISNTSPLVVMSLGENWQTFVSADEVENSGETTIAGYRMGNDNDFVSTLYIEDTFDDLITWMSPNILYTKMISSGQLP